MTLASFAFSNAQLSIINATPKTPVYNDTVTDGCGNIVTMEHVPDRLPRLEEIANRLRNVVDNNENRETTHAALIALGQTMYAHASASPQTYPPATQLKNVDLLNGTEFKPTPPSITLTVSAAEQITREKAIAAAVKHIGRRAKNLQCRDAASSVYDIHTGKATFWIVTLEV